MQNFKTKLFLFIGLAALGVWLGFRFIYFGSIFRNCIYTEQELAMRPSIATAKAIFLKQAVIVSEVYAPYKCLPEMASVENQIRPSQHGNRYDNGSLIDPKKMTYVYANSKVELKPVRLMAVHKHGISTIDSGSGPVVYLILKDQHGTKYQIPTVYLGLRDEERFIELQQSDGTKEVISAFSELNVQ